MLDYLHDALDFALQPRIADAGGFKAHGASAHAVDQLAGGVVDVAEKVRLGQRQAQNRNLQAREPHADARRNALLRQDGLEHEGHDFDDGLFVLGARFLLEFGGLMAQAAGDLLHTLHLHGGRQGGNGGAVRVSGRAIQLGQRRIQRRRRVRERLRQLGAGFNGLGVAEIGDAVAEQTAQLAQHTLGACAHAHHGRSAREHARFFGHAHQVGGAHGRHAGLALARWREAA